jgi:hypothetical protein
MTICEYCGRVHCATYPDTRLCSVVCRERYEQYVLAYKASASAVPTAADYRYTDTDTLADNRVRIEQEAAMLLRKLPSFSDKKKIADMQSFIEELTGDDSMAHYIHRLCTDARRSRE